MICKALKGKGLSVYGNVAWALLAGAVPKNRGLEIGL